MKKKRTTKDTVSEEHLRTYLPRKKQNIANGSLLNSIKQKVKELPLYRSVTMSFKPKKTEELFRDDEPKLVKTTSYVTSISLC